MVKNIFFTLISVILFASCAYEVQPDAHFTSFKELIKHFEKVPDSYKTVPFWVWNGEMTEEIIDEQLTDYAAKGFGGVFIHPRYGLITEYASQRWYELVSYANKRAKKLGLDIWIYDENSFPSGFGGGLVPAEMPSSYNEGHALKMHMQTEFIPDSTKNYLLAFEIGDSVKNITGKFAEYQGQKGEFLLYEIVYYPVNDWYAGYSYVDLLKPGVTEKFIEVTMTGYENHLESEFGKSVPGVFTDEPNIAPQGDKGLIRWTPDLFEQFHERWDYHLEPNLVSLVQNTPMSNQVRHNYYQLLLELFIERWSKPWFEYTEKQNLLWTGHYWEHGWPSPHHGPDNMAMYAWHQVPGIDMLFNNQEKRPDQFGNIRAVKELNSVANQLGKVRRLSETYGASGWELTFEDMKRNGDWEYVLGVNLMNQHLSYQTLVGDRKHDFPQSFSYHAPYWEEYPVLNEYFARLSLALSCGEQVNRTLVLEPTTSGWMNYSVIDELSNLEPIKNEFDNLLHVLEDEQIEFDLGSENVIRDHGFIESDRFVVGKRYYNYVVIPQHMTNMNSETADLLEVYLDQGGIVVALCAPPGYIDGKKSERILAWPEKYLDQWYSLGGCNDPRLINYLRSGDFIVSEQVGGELYHMRRELDDGHLLFLVNSSDSEKCNIRIITNGKDMVHLDPFTGRMENYPCLLYDDILSFDAEIEPAGSLLLFISSVKELKGKKDRVRRWNGKSHQLDIADITVELADDNALTLDYCSLIINDDTIGVDYFYSQQTKVFNAHGFSKNPWVSSSQFKTEIIDRDTFPEGSGFRAIYSFLVDSRFSSENLKLVVERPHLYNVKLNEELLYPIENSWWLDKEFGVFNISGKVLSGNNFIELNSDPMSVHCELEPVYLAGDFDVLALDKGWLLAKSDKHALGSWKELGMPFYSGKVNYTSEFNLDRIRPVKLLLKSWEGTVASVTVNGKNAGLIYSEPNELRLDKYVKRGSNTITVSVTGSLKNLLGPHHNVKQRGIVTPWSFKYAPSVQPSGIDYDLLDYGLLEPFTIEILQ